MKDSILAPICYLITAACFGVALYINFDQFSPGTAAFFGVAALCCLLAAIMNLVERWKK